MGGVEVEEGQAWGEGETRQFPELKAALSAPYPGSFSHLLYIPGSPL